MRARRVLDPRPPFGPGDENAVCSRIILVIAPCMVPAGVANDGLPKSAAEHMLPKGACMSGIGRCRTELAAPIRG